MTFEDRFKEALLDFLNRQQEDAVKVTAYEQTDPSSYGFCETCGPDPISVDITYLNKKGESRCYSYFGDLGELMRELT